MSESKANSNASQNGPQTQLEAITASIELHRESLNKGGRPRKIIDEIRVIELAAKGYRMNEIATLCGVSKSTLNRRYESACEKGRELMRGALRAKQMEVAMKGNPIMLIWLGKQELQQADKQEVDVRKQMTVRMVVGIEQNELNSLANGYWEDNPKELPETTPNDTSANGQKVSKSQIDTASELP